VTFPYYSTQLPGEHQVVYVGPDQLEWSYEAIGEATVQPYRFFGNKRAYSTKVYPTPAYSHDINQVKSILKECRDIAPLCAPVTVNVLGVIDKRLVNGWAQQQWEHYKCHTPDDCQCDVIIEKEDGTKVKRGTRNWDGVIALSGRTTEIHPAITRYVTPHEYGHIVEEALGLIRYGDQTGVSNFGGRLLEDWAKVRGVEYPSTKAYGPTTHHLMPSEIFANDFRFMCNFETDWWPHEEIVPALGKRGTAKAVRWWDEAISELHDCYDEATLAK